MHMQVLELPVLPTLDHIYLEYFGSLGVAGLFGTLVDLAAPSSLFVLVDLFGHLADWHLGRLILLAKHQGSRNRMDLEKNLQTLVLELPSASSPLSCISNSI